MNVEMVNCLYPSLSQVGNSVNVELKAIRRNTSNALDLLLACMGEGFLLPRSTST